MRFLLGFGKPSGPSFVGELELAVAEGDGFVMAFSSTIVTVMVELVGRIPSLVLR
jgi:hypothetical protein